jgi:hypothetical protein
MTVTFAHSNRRTVGSGVLYVVHAEAIARRADMSFSFLLSVRQQNKNDCLESTINISRILHPSEVMKLRNIVPIEVDSSIVTKSEMTFEA